MIFFFFFGEKICDDYNCCKLSTNVVFRHTYFGYGDFEVLRLFGSKKRWKVREERKRSVPL